MIEELTKFTNDDIFEVLPFYKINKRLTNFRTYQVSASIPADVGKIFDVKIDLEAAFLCQIKSELSRCVYKHISNKLRNTTKIDYIDLREYENKPFGHRINGMQVYDKVFSYINSLGYKNLISPSKIAAEMQDNLQFEFLESVLKINMTMTNYFPYGIGKIGNTSVWIDPYLKYNDDKIVLFDEIELNFDVKSIYTEDDSTLLIVEVNLCVGDINSMVVSVIEGVSSPSYAEYISVGREVKIDEIIK